MVVSFFGKAWRGLAGAAAAVALVAGLPVPAAATHFRYMTINWESGASDPLQVDFTVQSAWRLTSFGPTLPLAGGTVTVASNNFNFGDASSTTLTGVVQSTNTIQDYLVMTSTFSHQYAASPANPAGLRSCCRVSTLADGNNDRNYNIEIPVDLTGGTAASPFVGNFLPIILLGNQGNSTVNFNAGPALSYAFSALGNGPLGSGLLSIDPDFSLSVDGLLTFMPDSATALGLRAFQLRVTDQGTGAQSVADFMVQVVSGEGSNIDLSVTPTVAAPEPTGLTLFGLGLVGLGLVRRRLAG